MAEVAYAAVTHLNGGIIGPLVSARIDIDKYHSGCEIMENWLPMIEGPAMKRPGTRFVHEVKDSTQFTVIVPFRFSVDQTYFLEFGNLYMRVHRDGGTVLEDAKAISGSPTAASPVSITTAVNHLMQTGDEILVTGSAMTELNGKFFKITVSSGTIFTLDGEDGTGRTTGTGGTVAAIHEVVTPWNSADVKRLDYAQTLDVLYVVDGAHDAQKITRVLDNSWTVAAINSTSVGSTAPVVWPPFKRLDVGQPAIKVSSSAITGNGETLTATAALFTAADVGRFFKILESSIVMGYAEIVGFTSDTVVTIDIFQDFGAAFGTPTQDWAFSAFDAVNGFARSITFFEDRLWLAGPSGDGQSFWASVTGDFENFITFVQVGTPATISPDNSMLVTLNVGEMNAIEWMRGLDILYMGTRGGEFTITGADEAVAIHDGNISVKRRSGQGSAQDVRPESLDAVVMFPQRAGKQLRELVFDFGTDAYLTPNMNRLAHQVTAAGIQWLSFARQPHRIIWVGMKDGTVAAMTYERDEEVVAWSTHVFGGTGVTVEWGASNPTSDETSDETWFIVKRTINGITRRYIEFMTPFHARPATQEDSVYMDCAVQYSGVPATVLTGLDHLEGETVQILADGRFVGTKVVVLGEITLDAEDEVQSKATIGLGYEARFATTDMEFANRQGTSQGRRKNFKRVVLRLDQTGDGLQIGDSFDDMDDVEMMDPDEIGEDAIPLQDGDTERLSMPSGWQGHGKFHIKHIKPTPATICGIFPQLEIGD